MSVVCMGLDVTALFRACGRSWRFCFFLSSGDAITWDPEKAMVCLRGWDSGLVLRRHLNEAFLGSCSNRELPYGLWSSEAVFLQTGQIRPEHPLRNGRSGWWGKGCPLGGKT